jgi:hypothetical protein
VERVSDPNQSVGAGSTAERLVALRKRRCPWRLPRHHLNKTIAAMPETNTQEAKVSMTMMSTSSVGAGHRLACRVVRAGPTPEKALIGICFLRPQLLHLKIWVEEDGNYRSNNQRRWIVVDLADIG